MNVEKDNDNEIGLIEILFLGLGLTVGVIITLLLNNN